MGKLAMSRRSQQASNPSCAEVVGDGMDWDNLGPGKTESNETKCMDH